MIAPELVRQAQLGDQRALTDLLAAVRPMLVRYARRRVGPQDAEDLAQDALMRLVNGLPTFQPRQPIEAYGHRIISRLVIDAWRRASRDRAQLVAEVPEQTCTAMTATQPEEQALLSELRTSLARLVDTLTPAQRQIVLLRVVVGLSSQDTAELVDSTPGAVRIAQLRALRRLRKTAGGLL